MPTELRVEFRSLDGLRLVGDVVVPDAASEMGVLLVHGRGVTGTSPASSTGWPTG